METTVNVSKSFYCLLLNFLYFFFIIFILDSKKKYYVNKYKKRMN